MIYNNQLLFIMTQYLLNSMACNHRYIIIHGRIYRNLSPGDDKNNYPIIEKKYIN